MGPASRVIPVAPLHEQPPNSTCGRVARLEFLPGSLCETKSCHLNAVRIPFQLPLCLGGENQRSPRSPKLSHRQTPTPSSRSRLSTRTSFQHGKSCPGDFKTLLKSRIRTAGFSTMLSMDSKHSASDLLATMYMLIQSTVPRLLPTPSCDMLPTRAGFEPFSSLRIATLPIRPILENHSGP